jgi:DNA-binding transcriptional LysR family regulator
VEVLDLEYLLVTADAGRFALAARLLGVEKSTVSRRIAALEQELAVSLFERDHTGIHLTPAGYCVVQHARRVMFEVDAVKRVGQQLALGRTGEIRLGVRMPPVAGAAHSLLTAWRAQATDVVVTIIEGNERELLDALMKRTLDVVIVSGDREWPHVVRQRLFRENLLLAVPKHHRLAEAASVRWASLNRETLLVQRWENEDTQRELYAAMAGKGVLFEGHSASQQAIVGLVGTGAGLALVPESIAACEYSGVVFKAIVELNAWIDFSLIWLPEAENPVLGRFVRFLCDRSAVLRAPLHP